MFRTLAARLTAAYVFAAIVLVTIVTVAVTTFSLSRFGLAAREAGRDVVRQAPDEVRMQTVRHGTLDAAAGDIVRSLSRPGLRVILFATDPRDAQRRRFLAASGPDDARGRPSIVLASGRFEAGLPLPMPRVRAERMPPFPFKLNALLHLEPLSIDVDRARVTVIPDPLPLARAINGFWIAMLPIGIFVVVAAWLLGRAIAGQALRPLGLMTAALNRFGAGDFTPRPIASAQRNEIGELVGAYNAAAAQVSAAFEERRAAEAQMRQFVADAGHELRTPLTVIIGFVDVLRRRAQHEPSSNAKIYETMLLEGNRMRALIDKLIVLARLENPPVEQALRETVDLAEIAERVAVALEALGAPAAIVVHRGEPALVRGDETDLYDAVSNLAENALKYAPGAPVAIDVRSEGDAVVLDVVDRGPGIAPDEQGRIFDRFYRGRDRNDADGFGLGLAIAKRSVERAGGALCLESAPGAGARFTIRMPAAPHGERGAIRV